MAIDEDPDSPVVVVSWAPVLDDELPLARCEVLVDVELGVAEDELVLVEADVELRLV